MGLRTALRTAVRTALRTALGAGGSAPALGGVH